MLTIQECKKHLENKNLSEKRIEEIRDYLYAICQEIVRNNISNYKKETKKLSKI
jgi:hypothetical protein